MYKKIYFSSLVGLLIPKTYTRNLFFRTVYLLLLGTKPIFVLEGTAPKVKSKTIKRRLNAPDDTGRVEKKIVRSRLNSHLKQCVELLSCLGVSCVKAPGEAEAYCAALNHRGIACGVVTQDSDVFLYGATEVYRNFQMAPHFTCDVYKASVIQQKLGLTRTKMVALSLLTGCDYTDGVHKIGKESAIKFLNSVDDQNIFQRFREWRNESHFTLMEKNKFVTSDMQLELKIREKAILDPSFPDEEVIEEFLKEAEVLPLEFTWERPNIDKFISIAARKLAWDEEYARDKMVSVVTRWHLVSGGADCGAWLSSIIRPRVVRGVASYEVSWTSFNQTTVEPQSLVQLVYPDIVKAYLDSKTKPKVREKKTKSCTEPKRQNSNLGKKTTSAVRTLDEFITKEDVREVEVEEMQVDENELNLSNIINTIVSRPNSNPAVLRLEKYKH